MEKLLHFTWKHKMFPLTPLSTTDNKYVEVIDPGLHNHNSGPDFFNAKIKINDTVWVGNVEIHVHSSDWYKHHHENDSAYDNVILHVASDIDCDVTNSRGEHVPQMMLMVPDNVRDNYRLLLETDKYPPCYNIIPSLTRLTVHSWMAALQTERLQQKTEAIEERARQRNGSWEDAYFITLARNFGFGTNSDAFEMWASQLQLGSIAHHSDDLFQIEAMFLGQAGLLTPDDDGTVKGSRNMAKGGCEDDYFKRLSSEYQYLAHKFSLTNINGKMWRFMRMRPQNFPYIRISQLANLYYSKKAKLSMLTECQTVDDIRQLYSIGVSDYWKTHYTFGAESTTSDKRLSDTSLNVLVINTAVPFLFAYGRHTANEELCERAFNILDSIKAENNNITRMWQECGMLVKTAGDSQALIQLKKEYCDRKDCLRCRIGYEHLKQKNCQTHNSNDQQTNTHDNETKQ